MVFKGSTNTCIVDPKCLYSRALKCSASAVIVAHSHPSGDPTPSNEDIEVTKRLKEVGEIVGVVFLDHIILGDNSHISLKETHFF
ncbi:JAB domain-containing protein [Jeotgalicoccus sp. WY2]|uniref:JAB domain-containing protein n=1 Tax=Jeotgalicoccus sp. WY2 TaxID=2708346 RepID=UPI001BD30636